MPVILDRKVDTDDDGSGAVGTVRNNAWLQDLQDKVDAALAELSGVGTFTPTLAFGGASSGITYTTRVGKYIKVGTLVFVTIRITLSSKGSSTGAATITGLPFASSATYYSGLTPGPFGALSVSVASLAPYVGPSSTTVSLTYVPAAGGTAATNMIDTTFSNTTDLILTGCYPAAA